jgi:hypothetical protein
MSAAVDAMRRDLEATGLAVEAIIPGRNGGALAVTTDPSNPAVCVLAIADRGGDVAAVTLTRERAAELRDRLGAWLEAGA